MDTELKQYLDGMEGRINSKAETMEGRINAHVDARIRDSEERVVTLITGIKESLERQMSQRFDSLDARFDIQANRLDRQAALLQIGSRWTNRMVAWAERVDVSLDTKSKEIIDLNKRIDKKDNGAK
jgi:hypothetical protein